MRVWLTDQHGDLIDLRGEAITMRIHVREVDPVLKELLKISKIISDYKI